jgi:4-hydroxymandelate oxidase
MVEFANLLQLDELARSYIEPAAYDFIAGGAEDEVTLRENRAAFARWRLRPRYLVDVSKIDLATTVLGQPISFPVMIAPSAYHQLAHPDGELATARAAAALGTLMAVSTESNYAIGEIAKQGAPLWFQLYFHEDAAMSEMLIDRAVHAGAKAICLTIDLPEMGKRERDVRSGFDLPAGMALGNQTLADRAAIPIANQDAAEPPMKLSGNTITWEIIPWLHARSRLPIVVKGVMTAEDAALAVQHGAAAIIVSNHGGRQLDSALGTLDALPEVVAAVGGRVEVLLDGGVRRGTDVLKALALGARAVLLGRPIIYGLALGGTAGATRVLTILHDELERDMMLCGRRSIAEVDRSLVMPHPLCKS